MVNRFFQKFKSASALRTLLNIWPPFKGAGIRVKRISADFREIEVEMRLCWFNQNYVGTQFGGSLYAMVDPFYMLMLLNNLGRDYIVWDKAARIDFKKPGRGKVQAKFSLPESQIANIKHQADTQEKHVFDLPIDVTDTEGHVIANVVKTLYVKRKSKKP